MRFACVWVEREQAVRAHVFAGELGNGGIVHRAREFPCATSGFFHVAFDPALFFGRLAVADCPIGFADGFVGEHLPELRGGFGIEREQQHATGAFVQAVNQP